MSFTPLGSPRRGDSRDDDGVEEITRVTSSASNTKSHIRSFELSIEYQMKGAKASQFISCHVDIGRFSTTPQIAWSEQMIVFRS